MPTKGWWFMGSGNQNACVAQKKINLVLEVPGVWRGIFIFSNLILFMKKI
ncbi:MAG: hypothetical protein MUF15_26495 [Acidobacteria bacterium]|nr:hypothetical protein [Acidobacteriota bacterium]